MLSGKRIVVTGAGRGIGRAIAEACARAGAVVGLNYRRSEEGARALAAESPDRFMLLPFDVRDPAAVGEAVSQFKAGGRIDGWVNNAGIIDPGLLVASEPERLREQVEVNLLGPLFCSRAVLPVMVEQRDGVLLNIGSVAASRPARGQAAYAASKGGLEALTRALAIEYGRKGIRALCLRVGPVETEMFQGVKELAGEEIRQRVPLRRFGTVADVADLAVFLLSDRARFLTGSVHAVDGGFDLG